MWPGIAWIILDQSSAKLTQVCQIKYTRKNIKKTIKKTILYPNISQSKLLLLDGICVRPGHLRLQLFKPMGFYIYFRRESRVKKCLPWPTVLIQQPPTKHPKLIGNARVSKGVVMGGHGWSCETRIQRCRNRSPGQVAGGLAITIGGAGEGAAHFRST